MSLRPLPDAIISLLDLLEKDQADALLRERQAIRSADYAGAMDALTMRCTLACMEEFLAEALTGRPSGEVDISEVRGDLEKAQLIHYGTPPLVAETVRKG